eukprot:TRINITY_DN3263_c0_g1_i4.p1 TRINITY_DN3263_c0_g1~~TRINITY_DN3263_c0_g1_i4.p1  ORF type:complete len:191 (-),score=46.14 TRINITY_DN3263_c0_g1_i4:99-671(-)
MKLVVFVGILCLVACCSAGAVELNDGNFKENVFDSGKNAFVKFFAPWCGHCKAMKPAWDQLGDEYSDAKSVLIADVDCTENADLCGEYGVKGYPTLKYFLAGDEEPQAYQGGRDYDSLNSFIQENLEAPCTIEDQSQCSEKEVKFIAAYQAKSEEDRAKQLTRLQGLAGQKMKAELKAWVRQRINILKQF